MNPGSSWSLDAGQGVGVALIDTGVNPTADLRGDRLVRGPDLSGEGDGVDHFGHGTFMAGLIAGDGTASSNGGVRHVGVAPGATVVAGEGRGRRRLDDALEADRRRSAGSSSTRTTTTSAC